MVERKEEGCTLAQSTSISATPPISCIHPLLGLRTPPRGLRKEFLVFTESQKRLSNASGSPSEAEGSCSGFPVPPNMIQILPEGTSHCTQEVSRHPLIYGTLYPTPLATLVTLPGPLRPVLGGAGAAVLPASPE